ncbi:uncharacterized protein LOC142319522 [Lycorma delicatula]|uniref:uncharacterized protein LOC142319522 n=1 Tax=Lycorma delicatula TaxID=130591 RepID=UPI003F51365C
MYSTFTNMRFSALTLICVAFCVVCLGSKVVGQDYEEYADEPAVAAPPPKAAPRGLSALNRSARGPIIGRPQPKNQQNSKTTTTTTEAPAPDVYDDEPVDEELAGEEQPTTTTEAPKKFLKGGVVRPFRSNTDLIETLKRRRQQATQQGTVASTTTTTSAPASEKQFKNSGRRNSNKVIDQAGSDSNRKSSTANAGGRRFSPKSRQSSEPVEEEPVQEDVQPRSSRVFGRSRKV